MTPSTATAEHVWLRFQASLVAPFMDDESRHRNVLEGWTLMATSSTARAALARMLASTFERLTSLGDSWHSLSPDPLGARLHGSNVVPSRDAFADLFDHGGYDFDPHYETAPVPTVGSLRVAGATAAALVTGGERWRFAPRGPTGVPQRLALLRRAWAATCSHLRTAHPSRDSASESSPERMDTTQSVISTLVRADGSCGHQPVPRPDR